MWKSIPICPSALVKPPCNFLPFKVRQVGHGSKFDFLPVLPTNITWPPRFPQHSPAGSSPGPSNQPWRAFSRCRRAFRSKGDSHGSLGGGGSWAWRPRLEPTPQQWLGFWIGRNHQQPRFFEDSSGRLWVLRWIKTL